MNRLRNDYSYNTCIHAAPRGAVFPAFDSCRGLIGRTSLFPWADDSVQNRLRPPNFFEYYKCSSKTWCFSILLLVCREPERAPNMRTVISFDKISSFWLSPVCDLLRRSIKSSGQIYLKLFSKIRFVDMATKSKQAYQSCHVF